MLVLFLTGETAVKEGLIDELGGLNDAISYLYNLIEETPVPYSEEDEEVDENDTTHDN